MSLRKTIKIFSCILFLNTVSLLLYAQNPLVKQLDYRYGGTDGDLLKCFMQTADGGYILGGYSASLANGNKAEATYGGQDYWLVKVDSSGIKQWDKTFGGTSDDLLYSLQQTNDGGFILGGASWSDSSGNKSQPSWGVQDYWIVKIDSLGILQWDRDFGGTDNDVLNSIQQTYDGGYMLGGVSYSDSSGDKTQATWGSADYWIIKIDSAGNKQWDKDFGGTDDDALFSLQQTADSGYILGGYSRSDISGNKTQPSKGGYDYWIVKINSQGTYEWDKDLGGTGIDGLFGLQQTTDYGYILGGVSLSGIGGDKTDSLYGAYDYWMIKTDSTGIKEWDKDFGGTGNEEIFGNISQTSDGGYLLSGSSYSNIGGNKTENNLGAEQSWAVKTDSLGNLQWDKTMLTPGHDENGIAIETSDKCFAIANSSNGAVGGYKSQPAWNNSDDYWIVKFCDSTLTGGSAINSPLERGQGCVIFPNPNSGSFTITINSALSKNFSLRIIDPIGRIVIHDFNPFVGIPSNKSKCNIELGDLAKGLYAVEVIDGYKVYRGRFIVQ